MSKKGKEQVVKVTAQGSLGILALGAKGIKLWREAVELEKSKGKKPKKNDKKGK